MKHTMHLAKMFNAMGSRHLSDKGFSILMNIVHLEGRIYALKQLKEKELNPDLKHKYDVFIYENEKKILELTMGEDSRDFLERLADS